MNRLPLWFTQDIPDESLSGLLDSIAGARVNTVCRHAQCPNMSQCLKNKQLTFLILGDTCTRHCLFCAVKKANTAGSAVDHDEPARIAALVARWDMQYTVVTSVTRDDLPDGGAEQFVNVIHAVRNSGSGRRIEVLVPDFLGSRDSVERVVGARPNVFGHNIETVRRLYPAVRPQADYRRSLAVLSSAKSFDPNVITKSSIMLGLGENEYDVYSAMEHLRHARVDILTLGQYLSPSQSMYQVQEFISPEQFEHYGRIAREFGFKAVLSGPLVRSSWGAGELYNSILCTI
jgi:lipoyl synthase